MAEGDYLVMMSQVMEYVAPILMAVIGAFILFAILSWLNNRR